jgi:hypothetical protein
VAGKHRMSKFLREAAEAELLRREAAASLDKPKKKPKKGEPR